MAEKTRVLKSQYVYIFLVQREAIENWYEKLPSKSCSSPLQLQGTMAP
jgi:hypothetical protein